MYLKRPSYIEQQDVCVLSTPWLLDIRRGTKELDLEFLSIYWKYRTDWGKVFLFSRPHQLQKSPGRQVSFQSFSWKRGLAKRAAPYFKGLSSLLISITFFFLLLTKYLTETRRGDCFYPRIDLLQPIAARVEPETSSHPVHFRCIFQF